MIVETAYSEGDTVYAAEVTYDRVPKKCPDCLGTRHWKATLGNGEELDFTCPSCKYGYESRGTIGEYEVVGRVQHLTIGKVRVEMDRKPSERIAYMCEETGIGTGRIWYEPRLDRTREEAEARLPDMIAADEVRWAEQAAQQHKRRKSDGPARMIAFYRAQIRDARRDIKKAEEGLEREARRTSDSQTAKVA